MSSSPRISVITACFNHGHYVHEMISSVLAQTFKNFELIIVNDGSTDTTEQELDKVHHPRIRIIHSEHKGPSDARNLAIEHARAEIIINMDSDDRMAPQLLEKGLHMIESNPDWGIVYTDLEFFGSKTGLLPLKDYSLRAMLFDNMIGSPSFFRKSDWKLVGGYSNAFFHGLEDWDLWLSIIELGRGIYKIHEPLVFYRKYENPLDCRSGRRVIDREKLRSSLLTIFHRHYDLYKTEPDILAHYEHLKKKYSAGNRIITALWDHYRNIMTRRNY